MDLFPFPSTSSNLTNQSGIIYRQFLSQASLEESVKNGVLHPDVLTQMNETTIADEPGNPFLSSNFNLSASKIKGAIGYYFWLDPSRQWPQGLHGMFIKDRIYAIHVDQQTGNVGGYPPGGPPIVVKDTEVDSVWYPQSFCAPLIGLNLEDDRQLSNDIAISEVNRHGGWTLIPENTVSRNDLQQQFGGFVQYKTSSFGVEQRNPFFNITPPRAGTEGLRVGARISEEADETASQFPVNRGQAPGRIDSDAAVERLLAQSDMPNETFFRRLANGLVELHERVLDILSITWDEQKWANIVGPGDKPQEAMLTGSGVPSTKVVQLNIAPLVAGSRIQAMGLLNQLASTKIIGPTQYKNGLIANGLQPMGVDLKDREEEFAIQKTLFMYGDGQKPREWKTGDDFDLEPHMTIVRVIREFMNTIEFKLSASMEVRQMLRAEVLKHSIKASNESSRMRLDSQLAEDERDRFENNLGADEDQLDPANPTQFDNSLLGAT